MSTTFNIRYAKYLSDPILTTLKLDNDKFLLLKAISEYINRFANRAVYLQYSHFFKEGRKHGFVKRPCNDKFFKEEYGDKLSIKELSKYPKFCPTEYKKYSKYFTKDVHARLVHVAAAQAFRLCRDDFIDRYIYRGTSPSQKEAIIQECIDNGFREPGASRGLPRVDWPREVLGGPATYLEPENNLSGRFVTRDFKHDHKNGIILLPGGFKLKDPKFKTEGNISYEALEIALEADGSNIHIALVDEPRKTYEFQQSPFLKAKMAQPYPITTRDITYVFDRDFDHDRVENIGYVSTFLDGIYLNGAFVCKYSLSSLNQAMETISDSFEHVLVSMFLLDSPLKQTPRQGLFDDPRVVVEALVSHLTGGKEKPIYLGIPNELSLCTACFKLGISTRRLMRGSDMIKCFNCQHLSYMGSNHHRHMALHFPSTRNAYRLLDIKKTADGKDRFCMLNRYYPKTEQLLHERGIDVEARYASYLEHDRIVDQALNELHQ